MNKDVRAHRLYVGAVLVAGLAMLAWVSRDIGTSAWRQPNQSEFILWLGMVILAAVSPVPSPRGNSVLSLTPALDVGALLVFGPGLACWFAVLSRLVTGAAEKWNPFGPHLLGFGRSVLAVGLAGLAYAALGGKFGVFPGGIVQISALLAAVTIYLAVRVATDPALGIGGELLGISAPNARGIAMVAGYEFATVPFGILLALTQIRVGAVGAALFLLPLFLARYAFKLWIDTKRAHVSTVRTLMTAVDAGDTFTRGHSYRISKMCVRVARQLGLPEKDVEEIEYAALLHDLGRTALRRDVLLKAGRLDASEQAELRAHPKIAYDILRNLKPFAGAAEIVYAHHEQPDGKGYPRGLSGDDIPMGSRIIMTVAAFDAMTSERPYRRGLAPEQAFEELLAYSGTQFYPEVVEVLISLYADNSLFDEFEEEEFTRMLAGENSSRALEDFLRRTGTTTAIPDKVAVETAVNDELPVLHLATAPVEDEDPPPIDEKYALAGEGEFALVVAGRSDRGCVRDNNEDSYGFFTGDDHARGCLLVTADGMGGAAAGEVASALAVDAVQEAYFEDPLGGEVEDRLIRAMSYANRVIHSKAASEHRLGGMGTTCTVAVVVGLRAFIGHVGDSRAYLLADGKIRQLTRDHTLATEFENVVGLDERQTRGAHHVLTRCLGHEGEVEVEVPVSPVRLRPDATLLLCSDGLSNMVEDEELWEIAAGHAPAEACRLLVDLARERGGPDNITVQIARVS